MNASAGRNRTYSWISGASCQYDDLSDARRRGLRQPRQFSIVLNLAKVNSGFELMSERHQARHSRRSAHRFTSESGLECWQHTAASSIGMS